jgi:hypothetical protein
MLSGIVPVGTRKEKLVRSHRISAFPDIRPAI